MGELLFSAELVSRLSLRGAGKRVPGLQARKCGREGVSSLSGGYLRGRWNGGMLGLGACGGGRGLGGATAAAPLGARLGHLQLKLWDHELQLLSGLPFSAQLVLQLLPLRLGSLQTPAQLAQLHAEREVLETGTLKIFHVTTLNTSDYCTAEKIYSDWTECESETSVCCQIMQLLLLYCIIMCYKTTSINESVRVMKLLWQKVIAFRKCWAISYLMQCYFSIMRMIL